MAEAHCRAISRSPWRGVFVGGMSGLGVGGSDYLCGHCDAVMFADFDLDTLVGDYVFQCRACSGFNERPNP
jgi:hypothetical protein